MNLSDLISSKRVAGAAVAGLVFLAAKYHIVIADQQQADLAQNLSLAIGIVWPVITKIIDSRKAQPPVK